MKKNLALIALFAVSVSNFAFAAAGYPPNGYPCLGCKPCPPDYCGTSRAAVTAVQEGWTLTKDNKIIRDARSKGFGVQPKAEKLGVSKVTTDLGAGKTLVPPSRVETKKAKVGL